jgi:hypothetical protein
MNRPEAALIDELTFRSYVHNRMQFPDVAPERWRMIYGLRAAAAMEERFLTTFILKLIEAADEIGEVGHA